MDVIISSSMHGFPLGRTRRARGDVLRAPSADHGDPPLRAGAVPAAGVADAVYAPGWHQNFNTRDFAELYHLGQPVAAVYFNCQREAGSGGRRMHYPKTWSKCIFFSKLGES